MDWINTKHLLQHSLDWVSDGVLVVIAAMREGYKHIEDYLLFEYPEGELNRPTDTCGKRRTLHFRLRYLFRRVEDNLTFFIEKDRSSADDVIKSLSILQICVRQAIGEAPAAKLAEYIEHFRKFWTPGNPLLGSEEQVAADLHRLEDETDALFETLLIAAREASQPSQPVDSAAVELKRDLENVAKSVERLEDAARQNNALQRRSVAVFERKMCEEEDDPYSRLAGLDRITGARRTEVLACIRLSHERFPVKRNASSGEASLQALASAAWRLNRESFEGYARLAVNPGYRDERSLAARLYKLAARYPRADHFCWIS